MAQNTKLKKIAKRLRQRMTPAEKILWVLIRNNQLGVKFRRQMPFVFGKYRYVADFCCPKHKLIIEIDGSIHEDKEIKEIDEFREDIFRENGYMIIRFNNNEVLNNIEEVIIKIKEKIKDGPNI